MLLLFLIILLRHWVIGVLCNTHASCHSAMHSGGVPQPLKQQVAEPQHLFKMDMVLLQYHTYAVKRMGARD
jgi:hypothetical protein